jgi:hypothetical protein
MMTIRGITTTGKSLVRQRNISLKSENITIVKKKTRGGGRV